MQARPIVNRPTATASTANARMAILSGADAPRARDATLIGALVA
jgi:hypothetical protein